MSSDKKVRIAINGFGRIGRAAFKIALENAGISVMAVNDLGAAETLAYLLRYDSVYGRYGRAVTVEKDQMVVDGQSVRVLQEPDPAKLPWSELDIDVVLESTGVFTEKEQARAHLTAGAKRVIISAPTESEGVATVLMGVNDDELTGQDIISNASCTTNCVAPVVAILDRAFGVEKALMSTVHAYTATQSLVDGPVRGDVRRGRAGAVNIVPSSTGAAEAVTAAYRPLAGKFDGVALRVPVPAVSLSDVVALLKKKVTVKAVNDAFTTAAADPAYKDVLSVTSDAVVSSDFIGDPHSAIIDLTLTRVVGGNLVKVMAWYDNEWGYSNRLVEQTVALGQQ